MTPGLRQLAAAAALTLGLPAVAQDGAGIGGPDGIGFLSALETGRIETVEFVAEGSTGDLARDRVSIAAARAAFGLAPADRPTEAALAAARLRVEKVQGVAGAKVDLLPAPEPGRVRLRVTLRLGTAAPAGPSGVLAGDPDAFPVLWRDADSLLRVQLNGGLGLFSDSNPWFGSPATFTAGNPLVENPALGARTGDSAVWAEGYVEFGLSGVTWLGDTNFALYGAATLIAPASIGQDIFRGDARATLDVEKLYSGLLWGSEDRSRSLNLSVGRQNFTLNDGFLVSQFGSQYKAGPRPGIYLAPRTTHDLAVLGTAK